MKRSSSSPGRPDGELRPRFQEVAEAAQPFLAALVARRAKHRPVWIVCSDVRSQENLAAEVIAWLPEARLLPELDPPSATNCCPIRRLPPSDLRSWVCSLKKNRWAHLSFTAPNGSRSVPSDLPLPIQ